MKTFQLSNAAYDAVRWVVQILLPALGVFYATLGSLWGFPGVIQVTGTLAAFAVLLGSLLGLSRKNFDPPATPQ